MKKEFRDLLKEKGRTELPRVLQFVFQTVDVFPVGRGLLFGQQFFWALIA